MVNTFFKACCLQTFLLTGILLAQSDYEIIHRAFEYNPGLRAIRDRNMERYPVCVDIPQPDGKSSDSDGDAWRRIGRCALQQNQLSDAETAFRHAVEFKPTAEAYSLLGMALVREERLSDAVPILRKAATIDSHEDQIFRAWGAYYLAQNDLKRAASYYQKALDMLHPDGPEFDGDYDYATLAKIYSRMGDHSSAVEAFRNACFADICIDNQTTYNFAVELVATGQLADFHTLVDFARLGHEDFAKRLEALLPPK
jgi:tetratricopeptide (TPR) repeat protein